MIRIIHGRRYDTEKATKVCSCGSNAGIASSDFTWHDTNLYVTANGRWFLAGSGGALSRWARPHGQNGKSGGAGVEPLTKDEALLELEQRGEIDAIEKYFGDQVSDA